MSAEPTAVRAQDMTANRFRKKPVVIEAYQLARQANGVEDDAVWPEWLKEGWGKPPEEAGSVDASGDGIHAVTIMTLEGVHQAAWGDWIIRGVKGELYPCKPDIFAATYEPALATLTPHPDAEVESWRRARIVSGIRGGNAHKTTAELLRWAADRITPREDDRDVPPARIFRERANFLDQAEAELATLRASPAPVDR